MKDQVPRSALCHQEVEGGRRVNVTVKPVFLPGHHCAFPFWKVFAPDSWQYSVLRFHSPLESRGGEILWVQARVV